MYEDNNIKAGVANPVSPIYCMGSILSEKGVGLWQAMSFLCPILNIDLGATETKSFSKKLRKRERFLHFG